MHRQLPEPVSAPAPASAGTWWWRDMAALDDRHARSAAALIAVQRSLEKHFPHEPVVTQFLDLLRPLYTMPAEMFSQVWREPAACYWVRCAHQLLEQVLRGGAVSASLQTYMEDIGEYQPWPALQRHLPYFLTFSLGASHLAQRELVLDAPIEVDLPLCLAGTDILIEGSGRLRVLGLSEGVLRLENAVAELKLDQADAGNNQPGGPSVRHCPVIKRAALQLRMQPSALNWPGVDFVKPALEAGLDYQAGCMDSITQALALIEGLVPEIYGQIADHMETLVCKPLLPGVYTNLSHSEFPGAAVIGYYAHPHVLADTLIHEYFHNRLFALEAHGELSPGPDEAAYYSPWRDEPRPLQGLWHAVYVHLPVGEFWLAVSGDLEAGNEGLGRLAEDRLMRLLLRCRIGCRQLRRHAAMGELGQTLLRQLETRTRDLQQRALAAGCRFEAQAVSCLPDGQVVAESDGHGVPVGSVLQSIQAHIRRCDEQQQCNPDLQALLSA